MSFLLTEEQQMVQESARDFCRENVPLTVLRRLRDTQDARGFDQAIWQQIVALGWPGMTIAETYGGFGFGYTGLGLVLEESGRCLLSSPLIATVLLGSTAIGLAGNETQKQQWLPAIVAGEVLFALACEELPHHSPYHVATRARPDGSGYVLQGRKCFVLDGHIADRLIVTARTSGNPGDRDGISLFMVDAAAAGIRRQRTWMVDSRNAAIIEFDSVKLPAEALLGTEGQAGAVLDQVLDVGRIGLAAEMLGSVQEVFDRTVEYLKQREQFGVPIGAFQGLQHRLAHLYAEIELCKSVVRAALHALDHEPARVPLLASLAKARLSEVLFTVSNEGIQMHGGIGMTDEFDIGFFIKRARVAQQCLGDAAYHRNRYADLQGF
ncbi:MAG: hypothetical protein RLZZ385_534 [Pseudomonadota bacterium]|jgi:alkylation response protein AidB-like acyl-CoA dehydrogenase